MYHSLQYLSKAALSLGDNGVETGCTVLWERAEWIECVEWTACCSDGVTCALCGRG